MSEAKLKLVGGAEIKIEKGVPVPPRRTRKGISKYPFRQMEVGDSFLMPDYTVVRAWGILGPYAKRLGQKYTVRTVEGGARVWRVS